MESSQINYNLIAQRIIKEQEQIIGPLAIDIAKKISGVTLNGSEVDLSGDPKSSLEALVVQYSGLFGQASIDVSKDALKGLSVNSIDLPQILK